MAEVHVIALLFPKQDKLDRAEELLRNMCKDVFEKEPDALRYLMTTDTESNKPTIVMVETYKDRAAALEHGKKEWFQNLFKSFDEEDIMAKEAKIMRTMSTGGFDLDRKLL